LSLTDEGPRVIQTRSGDDALNNGWLSGISTTCTKLRECYRAGRAPGLVHGIRRAVERRRGVWPGRILEIRMDVSGACNLQCDMCYRVIAPHGPAHGGNMPLGTLRKVAAKAFPYAHTVFLSCAGEAFLSPHWPEGIRLARIWGVQNICIITNGVLVDEANARRLIQDGLTHLTFSVDGVRAETFESIRAGASFDEVIENLKRVLLLRKELNSPTPDVICTMVLRRQNLDEAAAFVDFMADMGVDSLIMQHMNIDNPALRDECPFYHPEAANDALDAARARARDRGITLHTPPNFTSETPSPAQDPARKCNQPWNSVFITYAGTVSPCWRLQDEVYGDLNRQQFEDIWSGEKYRALRVQHEGDEPLNEICEICSPLMTKSLHDERSFYHPTLDPGPSPTRNTDSKTG
jgi:radical SAM protein with 4Fe4S-binding SPASM domain